MYTDATLIRTAPSHAEADEMDTFISKPFWQSQRVISPRLRPGGSQSSGGWAFLKNALPHGIERCVREVYPHCTTRRNACFLC